MSDNQRKLAPGLVRDDDGILRWGGGGRYSDPGEAVKTWWEGKLRCGCTERASEVWRSSPCGKTPKHDPDANGNLTKCDVHSAAAKAKRTAALDAKHDAWKRGVDLNMALNEATKALEPSLRKIAEGHNDPRALAQATIAAIDAAREAISRGEA